VGVYKNGNRWYIDYYADGKRIRESATVPGVLPSKVTKTQAKKALNVRKAQIAEGNFDIATTKKGVLFDRLVEEFIKNYSKVNKKSWRRDVVASKPLLRYLSGKRISSIRELHIDKYKAQRLETISRYGRPISKATTNRELALLKTMFNYAIKRNWLRKSPLRVLSEDEFKQFYNEAAEHFKPILIMAYTTGMRVSEILNLKWENVDLDKGYLLVVNTKSGYSRQIQINSLLHDTLKSLEYSGSSEYVFYYRGERIGNIKTAFNAALRRSGVKKFTFHDLRHTFATNLVMSGIDLITVGELLGNRSVQMTMRYSHPTPDHKKKAVENLNIDLNGHKMDINKGSRKPKGNVTNREY